MSSVKQADTALNQSLTDQSMAGQNASGHFDEAAVAGYLADHPDFFERHDDLLAQLKLPHSTGGAVSLVERQVAVLRQRNDQLESRLREFVEVARGNDELANKIHCLAIRLMSTDGRAQAVRQLEEQLRMEFSADRSVLVLFGDAPEIGAGAQFLRHLDREDHVLGPFKSFLDSGSVRCGHVRDAQRDFLFGADDNEIGSVALIPLGLSSELGFLAIGARAADHFHPGMSIDFLSRLGEIVAGSLAR
jgi:uncharacterized protein YigA (DUF484 family)